MQSTRKKLIDLLEKREGYISGQELSNELDISRTAIWKHMNELKKDGYEIESVQRKGYRIISSPKKVSENTLQWGLMTSWLGKPIVHYPVVESTQDWIHQYARQDKPHGMVVVADSQNKGKGRMARSWDSPSGKGIWMSLLLRPEIAPVQAPQLTLLTATVLAEVLARKTMLKPEIKWPNDILINHKKVAGILTEMQAEHDRIQYIALGMGINVNQTKEEIPEDIRHKASSLHIESQQEWSVPSLIKEILHLFDSRYEQYVTEGFEPVKKTWQSYGYKIGERVEVSTMKRTWWATLIGIEPDGALKVMDDSGNEEKLYSAEIHWGEDGYHA